MTETRFCLDYSCIKQNECAMPVIIVAAGRSARMGKDKQLAPLCGIPVIARTMLCFEKNPYISRIIVVANEDNAPKIQRLSDEYLINKLTDVVLGGNSRAESVKNGLSRIAQNEKYVLIHDGARPLVSEKCISETALALSEFDCALCAVKVNDTVKLCNIDGTVKSTVDRTSLYLAQTPQGVNVEKYKKAIAEIPASSFTDDASIMENSGYTVKTVEGDPFNIKITTVSDLAFAETVIEGRKL